MPFGILAHRVRLLARDGLLAVLAAGHALAANSDSESALAVTFLLIGTLCIIARRRAPLTVLTVSGAAFCAYGALGFTLEPVAFAPLIALYTVTSRFPSSISMAATGATAIGLITPPLIRSDLGNDDLLGYVISLGAAWALGNVVRLNRARTHLLEEQAKQLERGQAARARLAVELERASIARELHDIIAHNVSVIVAQAGATRRVFDVQPERAREALGSIEVIGRDALTEMRRLLGLMRTDEGGTEWSPQPGLDQLPTLVEQIERAGLPVHVISDGNPRSLPAGVELSAFRIVQEALTNTLKHAGPAHAQVLLGYHPKFLEVTVVDDGRGAEGELTPGHGLAGMQQRAALLGGEVAAGARPGGGFQVKAKLPVNGERP